ncbi:BgTH12-04642 [Blumeria graminis f. sp. triticale]|uniref:BgTH12-04642 n=1 Tax=Blumeria graminis f. sp. triticale TaxID=1689686 RepID=A0A9W4CUW1_BLUGR|nr:BgTH12-04642 [Blumeria graminis f. sp. triticale]
MIRLDREHEARKADPFLLRQQVQRLIPDPSLVVYAWQVPSGVAVLAASPAKAASILQHSEAIAARFGNATVERQETWTTFVVGPIPKKVNTLDGAYDPLEGLLLEEPAIRAIKDDTPIRHIAWTRRSTDSLSPFGHIRIHVPEARAHKVPSLMQLFGQATSVQRVSNKQLLRTCNKYFGFCCNETVLHQYRCRISVCALLHVTLNSLVTRFHL